MSLQGSLDTFALPDVLVLLATTKKSGELRVSGLKLRGSLWIDDGQVVGGIAGRAKTPVDAVFELLRLDSGDFVFDHSVPPRKEVDPLSATDLLAEAQSRLVEWKDIEAVVPSLTSVVRMKSEAPGPEVKVSSADWQVLAGLGAGRPVHAVADSLGEGEFLACRRLKAMVEGGLVVVEEASGEVEAPPVDIDTAADVSGLEAVRERPADPPAPAEQPAEATRPSLLGSEPAPPAPPADDRPAKIRPLRATRKPEADLTTAEATLARDALAEVATPAEAARPLRPAGSALADQLAQVDRGATRPATAATAPAPLQAAPPQAAPVQVTPAPAPAAAAAPETAPEADAAQVGDDGQPIDRGLLLKFLSSVRS